MNALDPCLIRTLLKRRGSADRSITTYNAVVCLCVCLSCQFYITYGKYYVYIYIRIVTGKPFEIYNAIFIIMCFLFVVV